MLRELYQSLRRAAAQGETPSLATLAAALHTDTDHIRRMLEVLTWEGKVERIDGAGCGLEGEGCAACPLNRVCTRGVTHQQAGYTLKLTKNDLIARG